MPRRPVVPERHRALAPAEAASVLRSHRVDVEIVEERSRLLLGAAFEPHREFRVDVQRFAARVRVADDHGMQHVLDRRFRVADPSVDAGLPVLGRVAENVPARVPRLEFVDLALHVLGQRVVRLVHACEQRVATLGGDLDRVQQRAHHGRIVIGVIGVPPATDILGLIGLLAHLGDQGIAGDGGEEAVDVDGAPPQAWRTRCAAPASMSGPERR